MQKQAGWIFWLAWVGLTILAGLTGNFVADRLGLAMGTQPADTGILFAMLESGVFALLVSIAQWFVLRRLFSNAAWWVVAGTLGRAFGMLIGSMALVMISNQFKLQAGFWSTSIYLAARGAVLGASQWLILRQWRSKTGWWVLGSAIGWTLGSAILELLIPPAAINVPILGDLIDIAISAAVTGAVMVWIVRQPAPLPLKESRGSRLIVPLISVWAISWGVSWAVGWSIVRYIISSGYIAVGGLVGGRIAGGIAALIGGVGTAIVLKLSRPFAGLKIYHLVLLVLGWAGIVFYDWLDGFSVVGVSGSQNGLGVAIPSLSTHAIKPGMVGPLSGLVGGLLTALILFWLVHSLNWKQLALIVAGWTAGFTIGGWIIWTIGLPIALNYVFAPLYGNTPGISNLILFTLISSLCGAFAGWLGAAATLRQLSPKPSLTGGPIISAGKEQTGS